MFRKLRAGPCKYCGGVERIRNGPHVRCACRWPYVLFQTMRWSSRQRGLGEPTIDTEWIRARFEEYPFCHYTGIVLVPRFEPGPRRPNSPSLDRVDNAIGYTPENVRLTSWFWNNMRGLMTVEEAKDMLRLSARLMDVPSHLALRRGIYHVR